jgi:SnoaL-like domain
VHRLLTADFRIHVGVPGDLLDPDAIRDPQQMAEYVDAYRAHYPDPAFHLDEVVPAERGFAVRWTVTMGRHAVSGIDVAHVRDGRIEEVWSVTGGRRLPA